jgi:hypothetical protein
MLQFRLILFSNYSSSFNLDIYSFLGVLELIPAVIFLYIMHPQLKKTDRSYSPSPEVQALLHQSGSGVIISRVDSGIRPPDVESLLLGTASGSSGQIRRESPLVLQSKSATGYGSTTTGAAEQSGKI